MKKIDKDIILSKDYENWLDSLEEDKHPKYDSSNNKHYFDIKMSLLHCQKGLCAYTEQFLCDEKFLELKNWDKNKFAKVLTKDDKNSIHGDLEHFDENIKSNNAWLWDNLFVVLTHANCRIKHTKPVKKILKPDSIKYDETRYLQFDFETGVFIPHNDLTNSEKDDVKYMIDTLGINCVISQRKKQLENWKTKLEVGLTVEPYEYITAWKMTLENLK